MLALYNTLKVILQILKHAYKSFVVTINIFCLPKSTRESGAQWAVAQPLCEQSYFPLDEAEKVKTEHSSFSWKCPEFLGQEAFRAAPLEHLGRGTDAGGEPGCQIDRTPSVGAFFSRSQTFNSPKLTSDVKNYAYKRRYISLYI